MVTCLFLYPGSGVVLDLSIPDLCTLAYFVMYYYFAIILKSQRKLVALALLSYRCFVNVNVMWLFITVLWVGLQYVIQVMPDHTHLLFGTI